MLSECRNPSKQTILGLGVNPFLTRSIYRTSARGGFTRLQLKDPIKTEPLKMKTIYKFTNLTSIHAHIYFIGEKTALKIDLLWKGLEELEEIELEAPLKLSWLGRFAVVCLVW